MLLPETPTGASALEDVTEHEPLLGPEGRYPSEEKRPDDAPTARTSVNDDLSDSEDEADDEESDDEQLPRPAAPALQAPARYRYLAPVLILLAIGAMALMVGQELIQVPSSAAPEAPVSVAEAQEGQSAEVSAAVEAIVAELGGATSRRTGEEAPYDWERAGGYVHLAAGGGEAGGSGERSRHVIGILAKRLDRVNTERQLKELDTFIPDDFKAEVMFFHGDFPLVADMLYYANISRRKISYVHVDPYFTTFPEGFDPYDKEPTYYKDSKWGYQRMIYFWFRDVFHHPALSDAKYLMRLDTDSGIISEWPDVFGEMEKKEAVYFANHEDTEWAWALPGTSKMENLTVDYMRDHGLRPSNDELWSHAFPTDDHGERSVRTFYNNFEIVRLEWFLQPSVQDYTAAVCASGGIYDYRWGDAPLRYLTLALFSEPKQVLNRMRDYKFVYCHGGCTIRRLRGARRGAGRRDRPPYAQS